MNTNILKLKENKKVYDRNGNKLSTKSLLGKFWIVLKN